MRRRPDAAIWAPAGRPLAVSPCGEDWVPPAELLILDDAGFCELGRDAAHELFRLVCARHRQRSTILVSNLPFRKWGEFLPAQAVAIADRLIEDATILRFTGEPYRRPRDVHDAPLDGE